MSALTLIVDDDPAMLRFLRDVLERASVPVDVACDAAQAIDMMRSRTYHAVVCDINMPGMTGIELVSALKGHNPLVQVIMMTSDGTLRNIVDCVDRGAFEFLCKRKDEIAQLPRVVTSALERVHRWMCLLGRSAQAQVANSIVMP